MLSAHFFMCICHVNKYRLFYSCIIYLTLAIDGYLCGFQCFLFFIFVLKSVACVLVHMCNLIGWSSIELIFKTFFSSPYFLIAVLSYDSNVIIGSY